MVPILNSLSIAAAMSCLLLESSDNLFKQAVICIERVHKIVKK